MIKRNEKNNKIAREEDTYSCDCKINAINIEWLYTSRKQMRDRKKD